MTSTTPGDDERADGAPGTGPIESGEVTGVEPGVHADESPAELPPASGAAAAGEPSGAESSAATAPVEPIVDAAEPGAPAAQPEAPAPAPAAEPNAEPVAAGSAPVEPVGAPVADDTSAGGASDAEQTARLDAAVERATAVGAETGEVGAPAPVPADAVRRETYVPAASVATGAAVGAATLAPEPVPPVAAPAPQAIYVQAPAAPRPKGNRAFGVLVALIGTVLFALLYLGAAYLLLAGSQAGEVEGAQLVDFVSRQVYWVPVAVFFLGFALLAAIVNRGRWWAYVVFGVLVAAAVYFSYVGGALWTVAWEISPGDVPSFVAQRWLDPFAVVAFVIAREIPIWLGGWIAARGRAVTERNRIAYEAYERELAAGPQPR
ncbi:hypothetical protein ACWKWP_11700 [Agromyces soli]